MFTFLLIVHGLLAVALLGAITHQTASVPLPWSQGPRRMGTDKNANVLWVGNSWGANFARIDTKTMETRLIPFPDVTM